MNINYEFPDDLHKALKIRAAQEGVTLKDLIIRFLVVGLGGCSVEGCSTDYSHYHRDTLDGEEVVRVAVTEDPT